jgi:CyaY protein
MEERAYQHVADATLRRIEDAFKDVDPDVIDCERVGDVVSFTLVGGKKFILNTQRPTRQLWLAANARAWHFDWDEAKKHWVDDKGEKNADGTPLELFGALKKLVKDASGVEVHLAG